MNEAEFFALWTEHSTDVADKFYPKGDYRRGEYLRDQAVLFVKITDALLDAGVLARVAELGRRAALRWL